MKVTESLVKKLLIAEVPGFDPITVVLEDFGEGRGKIIVEVYGSSYAAYWGAMGGSLVDFVTKVSSDYIVDKFSCLPYKVFDAEGLYKRVCLELFKERRNHETSAEDARELYELAGDIKDIEDPANHGTLLFKFLGDDWFEELPLMPNPERARLCKMVECVQAALSSIR